MNDQHWNGKSFLGNQKWTRWMTSTDMERQGLAVKKWTRRWIISTNIDSQFWSLEMENRLNGWYRNKKSLEKDNRLNKWQVKKLNANFRNVIRAGFYINDQKRNGKLLFLQIKYEPVYVMTSTEKTVEKEILSLRIANELHVDIDDWRVQRWKVSPWQSKMDR